MSETKKFWRLQLDYDTMSQENVEQDIKRLSAEYPSLGDYRLEQSKSGSGHWHAIFPHSQFTSFEEAFSIAMKSAADPDWLDLCERYKCFGLETDRSRYYNEIRQQREKKRVVNKATGIITSPVILDLVPTTALDARRIVKVCEAIRDETWQFKAGINVFEMKTHVWIGCINEAQATRRMTWLSENGLGFTATIKQNTVQ